MKLKKIEEKKKYEGSKKYFKINCQWIIIKTY